MNLHLLEFKPNQSLAFWCLVALITLVAVSWTFVNKVLLEVVSSNFDIFTLLSSPNNSITFVKDDTTYIRPFISMSCPLVDLNLGHIIHIDSNKVVRATIWFT